MKDKMMIRLICILGGITIAWAIVFVDVTIALAQAPVAEPVARVNDLVWVALIATIVPLANIVMTYITARKAAAALLLAQQTVDKLDIVHGQIDGMKDQLVAATKVAGQAEGEVIGREKAASEQATRVEERERVEDRVAGRADTEKKPDERIP